MSHYYTSNSTAWLTVYQKHSKQQEARELLESFGLCAVVACSHGLPAVFLYGTTLTKNSRVGA